LIVLTKGKEMTITKEEKKEFIAYCWKTGFFIKSVEEWKETKYIRKVKQYKRKGYRIVYYNQYNEFKIINIFGEENTRIIENIEMLYLEALS